MEKRCKRLSGDVILIHSEVKSDTRAGISHVTVLIEVLNLRSTVSSCTVNTVHMCIFTGLSIRFNYDSYANDSRCISVYGMYLTYFTWLFFSLFKFPSYSESPSNDQTAAVCKIKAASCLYKTRKHVSISSALHVCCDLTVILFSHGSF